MSIFQITIYIQKSYMKLQKRPMLKNLFLLLRLQFMVITKLYLKKMIKNNQLTIMEHQNLNLKNTYLIIKN